MDNEAGWVEYRRQILSQLERIRFEIDQITGKIEDFRAKDLAELRTDIALLKFQAALWGSIAGTLFSAIATAVLKVFIK
jgi:hypothetical protein